MQDQATHASGHVFCVERKRGPQRCCKFRVCGRQVQKRLGPALLVSGPPAGGLLHNEDGKRAGVRALKRIRNGCRCSQRQPSSRP